MEIIYGDNILTINEELSGWFQFVLKSKLLSTESEEETMVLFLVACVANLQTVWTGSGDHAPALIARTVLLIL